MDKTEGRGIDISGKQNEHIKKFHVITFRKVTGNIVLFPNEKPVNLTAHMSDL